MSREWDLFKNLLFDLTGRLTKTSHFSLHRPSNMFGANGSSSAGPKKRRKSDNSSGTISDWEYLMMSEGLVVHSNVLEGEDLDKDLHYKSDNMLYAHIPVIYFSMHLLYEELKLDSSYESDMKMLSEFLYQLSIDFDLENYRMHYFQDNPQLIFIKNRLSVTDADGIKLKNKELLSATGKALSIFEEVHRIIEKSANLSPFPYINQVNPMSKHIIEVNKTKVKCIKNSMIILSFKDYLVFVPGKRAPVELHQIYFVARELQWRFSR